MSKSKNSSFKFRKHLSIGAMDAFEDEKYLDKCFVDTGDRSILLDTTNSRSILLGRTGSGKSALLELIKKDEENTISLLPQELSLNYIANSNIIRFFENLGIKLDIFYQLLWRHVLVVELIRYKFNICDEGKNKSFFDRLGSLFTKNKKNEEAISYLMEWGDKFWLETDKRIKELTTKLENELKASVDFKAMGIPLTASGIEKMSSEVKEEITHRAQCVVNDVQIQKLNRVISLLSEDVFTDSQQKYYILIDKLDDDWVEDELRYRLIRALIETVKTFRKIVPVKIIIALRSDLLSRVFEKTRDSGFQEEKYEDLIFRLKWNKEELKNVLDKRINFMIREQYTKQSASFDTIFTTRPNGEKSIDYVLNRTFMRPRDSISFVNLILEQACGKAEISTEIIKLAEKHYSKKRFNALCHEWYGDYPCLEIYCGILKSKRNGFRHSDVISSEIDEIVLALSLVEKCPNDPIKLLADKMFEEHAPSQAVIRNNMFRVLYRVGILGVKKASFSGMSWSQDDEPLVSESEVKNATHFDIHPMLCSYLGINFDKRKKHNRVAKDF